MSSCLQMIAVLVFTPLLFSQVPFYGQIIGSAASGRTLYASTGPGYFKSIDDGATWSPVYVTEAGLDQPDFTAFAVDPMNESNLYLATSPSDGALWKSTNAGATWRKANRGLPEAGTVTQSSLLVANTGALYLRMDTAVFRSRDGGDTWTRLAAPLPGNARAFDINRSTPTQMLYGASDSATRLAAVWKSVDEGTTWRPIQTIATGISGITGISTEPNFPDIVYVSVAGGTSLLDGNIVTGVHTSTNGGSSFTRPRESTQPIRILADHAGGGPLYTAGSTGTICRSLNRGVSFTCIPNSAFVPPPNPTSTVPQYVERRNGNVIHAIATQGTNRTPLMYRSNDAGETFRQLAGTAQVTFARSRVSLAMAPEITASTSLAVSVVDLPGANVAFTATPSGEPWFRLNQSSGRTPATLTMTFESAGLPVGSRHEGSIRVESPHAEPMTIPIVLEVTRPVMAPAPVYTFSVMAGNGGAEVGPDGGLAVDTSIGDVSDVALDRDRNVFFLGQNRIRRVSAAGVLSTVIGNGTTGSAPDGTVLLAAPLNRPGGLAVDKSGVLYFGESGGVVRRVAGGTLSTALRAGQINATGALLLALDPQDRLWLANLGRLYRWTSPGSVQAVSLTPTSTTFSGPAGMAIDAQGNLYVTPTGARRIFKITPSGVVSVFAGNGTSTISEGVPALATGMDSPTSLATDPRGNVLFVESRQGAIRLINPAGIVYTIARREGEFPRQIATDADSNVYASGFRTLYKYAAPPLVTPTLTPPARNLASGEPALSPGALFSLTGENLAWGEESVGAGQEWPRELAGAAVTVNGVAAVLSQASPGRLTGQIPPGLEPGMAKLVVTVNGVASPELELTLQVASPGIFSLAEDAERAAEAEVSGGEASVLVTGYAAAASLGFRVIFNEEEIEGLEIVAVPDRVGVGRARFRLPDGVSSGSHTVRIRIADATSNAVRISLD